MALPKVFIRFGLVGLFGVVVRKLLIGSVRGDGRKIHLNAGMPVLSKQAWAFGWTMDIQDSVDTHRHDGNQ